MSGITLWCCQVSKNERFQIKEWYCNFRDSFYSAKKKSNNKRKCGGIFKILLARAVSNQSLEKIQHSGHGQNNLSWLGFMLFASNLEVHHVLKVRIFQIDISALKSHKITKIKPLLSLKIFELVLWMWSYFSHFPSISSLNEHFKFQS